MRRLTFIVASLCMTFFMWGNVAQSKERGASLPEKERGASLPEAEVPPLGTGAQVTQLSNGLTVLVMEDTRFPLVSTRLYVHAGSAYEKPAQAGISHLLEHMVFKGTDKRPKGEISREVESAGGYLNAATSFDYTVYITDMPDRHWKLGMDVVKDMAFHARLDPAELESEKKVVLAELQRGKDNPGNRLFNALQAGALKGTPYARPIIGFENTIASITAQDMRDYIHTYYQPRNMLLVVVGNVKTGEVLAEAEARFKAYTNDTSLSQPLPIDAQTLLPAQPAVVVQPGAWNKVYLAAALPVPGSADYQSSTLDVLAQLLGGDSTSRFYRTYKYERQLVDSISVSNYGFERVGLLLVTAELDADKVEPFWKALMEDMASLKADQFSKREIARATLNLEDGLYRAKETLSGLAGKLGYYQFFLGGEQGEINTVEALRSVDVNTLQTAMNTWLNPTRLTTVVLPPKERTLPDFAALTKAAWATPATSTVAGTAVAGAIETVDLGQGRTVVLIPDKTLPYLSLDMAFSGGDALLTPDQQGLAALTARVLTKGTAVRDAKALQDYLADRAASLGASAGRQTFAVSLQGPARFNADLLALFTEVLSKPTFAAPEVQREKASQAARIRSAEDQPLGLAFRKLSPFLFPGSVYGYDQLGQVDEIMGMKPAAIESYWEKQKERPWVLAVGGDFDREAILDFARKLPAPKAAKVTVPVPAWGKDKALTIPMPGREQAHLMLVCKTAPITSPDTPALNLIEAVLGGMGGPLFRELRDVQGLGYTVSLFQRQSEETGYMVFYIGTEPASVDKAEAGFTKLVRRYATELMPKEELARGVNQLEGDYYRNTQTLGSRTAEAAGLLLTDRPLDFNRVQIEKTRAVTPEQFRDTIGKYLNLDEAYVVKVLP